MSPRRAIRDVIRVEDGAAAFEERASRMRVGTSSAGDVVGGVFGARHLLLHGYA